MGSPARVLERPPSPDVDRGLVERARGGDQDAFAEIVRLYQRRVYGVAIRLTRRHEVADDVAQDTFLRAYRNLERFELGRPLGPWLVRIATNLALNYLGAAARREDSFPDERGVDGTEPLAVPGPGRADVAETDPARRLMTREMLGGIARALDQLKPEHRAVLLLRVEEGMRYDEIAETLAISRGTVMSRLHRARARMKKLLEDYR